LFLLGVKVSIPLGTSERDPFVMK